MAKRIGNREVKKPKQTKPKTNAALSVSELANARPQAAGKRK